MAIKYLNEEKLFRARRIVAAQKGVNIELVPDQDADVLKAYGETLAGKFLGELETPKVTKGGKLGGATPQAPKPKGAPKKTTPKPTKPK